MTAQGAAARVAGKDDEVPLGVGCDPFLSDCLHGLAQPQKALPCKWLYDEVGSALFERICETPEYYPSRTATALLAEAAPELAGTLPPNTMLVEFGSGASHKNAHKQERDAVDAMIAASGWALERRWSSDLPSYDLILLRCRRAVPDRLDSVRRRRQLPADG